MTMPRMKQEVAIDWHDKNQRIIYLFATVDAKLTIQKFGDIDHAGETNQYRLSVDARYDFDEVVAYINATYPREDQPHE